MLYEIGAMKSTLLVLFLFFSSLTYHVQAQSDTITKSNGKKTRTIIVHEIKQTDSVSKYHNVIYTLVGDTLFTNKDFKIFVGKKLFVGNGSSENGWYKTTSLNSAIDWYSVTLAVLGTQNTETLDERELRINNLVRDCLHQEGTLYVSKIKKYRNDSHTFRYVVILRSRPGKPNTNYRCNIQTAIETGEILLPNE
jgi:hypothetical protein